MRYCCRCNGVIGFVKQVGIILAPQARLVKSVHIISYIYIAISRQYHLTLGVVCRVAGLHCSKVGEFRIFGFEYLWRSILYHHSVRIISSCFAIAAKHCQSIGNTHIRQIVRYIHKRGISQSYSIFVVVVVSGNTLYVCIYLCFVAYNLNITDLAVALGAVKHEKAVLEYRTGIYFKRGVMREVGALVIYLQEDIVRHRRSNRKVKFEESFRVECILYLFAVFIGKGAAPIKLEILEVLR